MHLGGGEFKVTLAYVLFANADEATVLDNRVMFL